MEPVAQRAYGSLDPVVLNSLVFIIFAFSSAKPQSSPAGGPSVPLSAFPVAPVKREPGDQACGLT